MIEDKFGEKVEADDPKRCQSGGRTGQCPYARIEGSEYCVRHAGPNAKQKTVEKAKNAYRLSKWQGRVNEFAEDSEVKSLRGEIGITRMLLEEIVNQCTDTTSLMMYSGKIADLVTRIEKLVSACHRLEERTGMLLDKGAALHLAGVIVEIIAEFVSDEEAIDNISNQIVASILSHKPEIKKA